MKIIKHKSKRMVQVKSSYKFTRDYIEFKGRCLIHKCCGKKRIKVVCHQVFIIETDGFSKPKITNFSDDYRLCSECGDFSPPLLFGNSGTTDCYLLIPEAYKFYTSHNVQKVQEEKQ